MMVDTDDAIISDIIKREGGYINDPADPGGATKFGITRRVLEEWRSRPVSTMEVQALTEMEARTIYLDRYVVKPGFHRVDGPELRAALVDAAVNHGVRQAVQSLQRAVGINEDGILGPETLAAVVDLGEFTVRVKFAAERVRLYGRIISAKPEQAKFAAGWLNRAAEFVESLA